MNISLINFRVFGVSHMFISRHYVTRLSLDF